PVPRLLVDPAPEAADAADVADSRGAARPRRGALGQHPSSGAGGRKRGAERLRRTLRGLPRATRPDGCRAARAPAARLRLADGSAAGSIAAVRHASHRPQVASTVRGCAARAAKQGRALDHRGEVRPARRALRLYGRGRTAPPSAGRTPFLRSTTS